MALKMEESTTGNQLKALSLSYLEAPIEIREQLTFSEAETKGWLIHLKEFWGIDEAFLISTCNRTEVYYNHSTSPEQLLKILACYRTLNSDLVRPYFQFYDTATNAISHLLRVGIGLESQVLGDLQIIGQVKDAYQWCADVDMAGPYLHKLLHTLFFINKKVVQETNFRSGSASVAYATKELIEDLVADKSQPITLIGLGAIGMPILKNLLENGYTDITVCNRSKEKAEPYIVGSGVKYLPFESWKSGLSSTIVISALAGNLIHISSPDLAIRQQSSFQYLIDLGMPRSIDQAAANNDGIVLFNLDNIQSKVSEALHLRTGAIPHVERIIESAQNEFEEWAKEMQVSPVIHRIKHSLEQIRQEEMGRFLKRASQEQAEWADELTRNLMQRLMKTHVVALKAACKRDEAEQLVTVLNQLFTTDGEKENAPSLSEGKNF